MSSTCISCRLCVCKQKRWWKAAQQAQKDINFWGERGRDIKMASPLEPKVCPAGALKANAFLCLYFIFQVCTTKMNECYWKSAELLKVWTYRPILCWWFHLYMSTWMSTESRETRLENSKREYSQRRLIGTARWMGCCPHLWCTEPIDAFKMTRVIGSYNYTCRFFYVRISNNKRKI